MGILSSPAARTEKTCPRCKQRLPASDFGVSRTRYDGLAVYCRQCANQRLAQWRAAHPDAKREIDRRVRRKRHEQRRCIMCGAANERWPKKVCGHCASLNDVLQRPYVVASGPCALCGFAYADVHHIDGNHGNNHRSNLIALCPNHHRLVHRGLLTVEGPGLSRTNAAPTRAQTRRPKDKEQQAGQLSLFASTPQDG